MSSPPDARRLVELLYRGVLRRAPDEAGLAHFAGELERGRDVASLLEEFIGCEEFRLQGGGPLFVPPGHFYSPVVKPDEVARAHAAAWQAPPDTLPGITLDAAAMAARFTSWLPILRALPFPEHRTDGFRYHYVNDSFSYGDAAIYVAMLLTLRPARVVEIGSGFSSALLLDVASRDLPHLRKHVCFIEPHPALLRSLLTPSDLEAVRLIDSGVQTAPLEVFEELGQDDILFIDSTHVLKTGSDVAHELFEVLPRLKPGVCIHFHDMFYPFEYPPSWAIAENRSWNEVYALRAFLMDNPRYEVMFFNDFFARRQPALAHDPSTPFGRNTGGSLWLRKLG